ncbi:putative DNA binding domain-containing protein [Oligoflexia bacterium]|nr:putative DNA binding domain-containing protein [Oligoflexia bacterium]
MDLQNVIENEQLEFKRELPKGRKLAHEVIAFANTRGGKIIIGYDEKEQKVIGVTPDQKTEERIVNIIQGYCAPNIDYSISYETYDNVPLLVLYVEKGVATPFHLKNKPLEEGAYIRAGSTTRIADRETLARLIREGKNISFDSEVVSTAVDFNSDLLQPYFKQRHARLGADIPVVAPAILTDLFLLRRKKVTVAGALLFTDKPQDIPELSNAYIKAARFKGKRKGIFIDQKELLGPATVQIDEGVKFVLRNIRLHGQIKGVKRKERYEYPLEIVREVIVNAVIHRDYSVSGSAILLAIYDDRIEITSPGGLPGPVTVNNISDRQYNRNPILAKRMFEMGYFDSWGQGIDTILAWASDQEAKKPEFLDEGSQFTLVLYPEKSEVVENSQEQSEGLSDREEKVLKYIQHNNQMTNKVIQDHFQLSKTQVQVVLRKLLGKKLIQLHGAGRGTYYTTAYLD